MQKTTEHLLELEKHLFFFSCDFGVACDSANSTIPHVIVKKPTTLLFIIPLLSFFFLSRRSKNILYRSFIYDSVSIILVQLCVFFC